MYTIGYLYFLGLIGNPDAPRLEVVEFFGLSYKRATPIAVVLAVVPVEWRQWGEGLRILKPDPATTDFRPQEEAIQARCGWIDDAFSLLSTMWAGGRGSRPSPTIQTTRANSHD